MPPFEGDWRIIGEESWDGPMNMALDEIASQTAASGGPWTVRVYQWNPSTLSLGYHQNSKTVDWEYCNREGISVTRRPTGGGGIYHDRFGDISYSIVMAADDLPTNLLESYHLLLTPIFDAFDQMGVDAHIADEEAAALHPPACYLRELNPAHDVVVDGRKISGNAQRRPKETVIQHGSITYSRNADRHLATFSNPGVTVDEFNARVTSIRERSGVSREEAVEAIKSALRNWVDAYDGDWMAAEIEKASAMAAEKYASEEWSYRH